MKKIGFNLLIGMLIFLFFMTSLTSIPVRCENGQEYERFLKQPGLYSKIINYLRGEQKKGKPLDFKPADYAVLFIIDLFLSLFCLWLTIWLLTWKKTLSIKIYSWFLFIINFGWFIFLSFFKIIWHILDFLVISLRPDLKLAMIDNLTLVVIVTAMLIYIWFLARTFNLSFFGASAAFLFSHLCYFLVIFLFFLFADLKENRFFNLSKASLGVRQTVKTYLLDVKKITSGESILSFIRIRPFHL